MYLFMLKTNISYRKWQQIIYFNLLISRSIDNTATCIFYKTYLSVVSISFSSQYEIFYNSSNKFYRSIDFFLVHVYLSTFLSLLHPSFFNELYNKLTHTSKNERNSRRLNFQHNFKNGS